MAITIFLQNPQDEFPTNYYLLTHVASTLRDNFISKDIESPYLTLRILDSLISIRQ